ncbi:ABC transporter substrate-binding protein [Comamonas sp. 26]|uniref:ABC transporter substrate-binding protein n=1 Tax=Comamonas sp. 26 TaxID=2035201 RepID=UPI000C193327|nr:ABC transporter substrate-binding protein [Comamonas sp. 26]PIF98250.1 ABC-type nitrate/sulfonate/bicarbonate transport system substrate-binding protein [Comamonas sp. 26]
MGTRRDALSKLLFISSASLGLAACSHSDDTASSQTSPADKLAQNGGKIVPFNYPDNPSFDLIYLADRLGYFEGTSTRPNYIGKVAAPQIIPLVGTGDIHFGARMVPLVISAIAAGADMKVIAAGSKTLQEAPHMKYFVRKDSAIRTPKDLEGKTIGFNSFGACAEFVSKTYFREHGADVSKINFLVVPDNQNEQAVLSKNVDLAIIHPPHSGGAEANPELLRLWSDYDLDRGLGGMSPYSVNGKFARENPQAVRDVVTAIAKAGNWVNAHTDEARQYTAERLGMDLKHVERYAYVDDQIITEPPIQYYIDILEREGKLQPGKVSVKDVYTNAFNPFVNGTAA